MFRALTTDGVEVKGYHCECDGKHYIFTIYRIGKSCSCCDTCDCPEDSIETANLEEINPLTLGLETGQLDKNKVMIVGGWGPGLEKGGDTITCLNSTPKIVRYHHTHNQCGFNIGTGYHEIIGWKAKEIT